MYGNIKGIGNVRASVYAVYNALLSTGRTVGKKAKSTCNMVLSTTLDITVYDSQIR